MRRLALLVVAAAVLILPSPSYPHAERSTSTLTGTITRTAGGISVSITNAGTDSFNYFLIKMVPSVHHTGATIDRGGGCGAGPDSNTVRCGISFAGFRPGETYTVTITTDVPYPANGDAELFAGTGTSTSGPWNPAGTATGPPGPPPQPCRCLSLTAKILAKSLKLEVGPAQIDHGGTITLHFTVAVTLTCSAGTSGSCDSEIKPVGKGFEIIGDPGKTKSRAVRFELDTDRDRAQLAKLGRLPIRFARTCEDKRLPAVTLYVGFDKVGRIALAKSRLG
jgi:hypothetical protein